MIGPKPLRIRFNQIDGFIRVCDGTRSLVLFGPEKYDAIYNRIRCLISQETGITYVFSHYYAKIVDKSSKRKMLCRKKNNKYLPC